MTHKFLLQTDSYKGRILQPGGLSSPDLYMDLQTGIRTGQCSNKANVTLTLVYLGRYSIKLLLTES